MSRICQSQKRTPAQTRTLQEHYFRRDADKLWEALRQALASFYDYDQMTIFLQARADQMELVESV